MFKYSVFDGFGASRAIEQKSYFLEILNDTFWNFPIYVQVGIISFGILFLIKPDLQRLWKT